MAFKVGQSVIWLEANIDPKKSVIASGVVSTISGRNEVMLTGEKYPRYSAFLYPDTPECRAFLEDAIAMNIRHKNENDAFMNRTYQFNNELVKAGLK